MVFPLNKSLTRIGSNIILLKFKGETEGSRNTREEVKLLKTLVQFLLIYSYHFNPIFFNSFVHFTLLNPNSSFVVSIASSFIVFVHHSENLVGLYLKILLAHIFLVQLREIRDCDNGRNAAKYTENGRRSLHGFQRKTRWFDQGSHYWSFSSLAFT